MIIPIGHENSAVRRLPWVTWSICLACIAAFLMTDIEAAYQPSARDLYMQEATEYFREHAYLAAGEEVLDIVRYDVPPNQRSQYVAALAELAAFQAPETPEGIAEEQAELDRLTAIALGHAEPPGPPRPANPFETYGLTPASPSAFNYLSHLFVHGGWLHLIGNLLLLFVMGPAIEDRWGRPVFAVSYLLAGILAGGSHALMTQNQAAPLIGASGAISGVLGAFMVVYWSSQIRYAYFFWIGIRILRGTFDSPAWLMLPLGFAKELFNALFWDAMGMGSSIAYWAHVGGFAGGTAIALGIRHFRIEERFVHDKIEAQITVAGASPAVEAALQAREDGDLETAFAMLEAEVAAHPGNPDATIAFWDVACASARPAAAAPALAKLVQATVAAGHIELATQHWLELTNFVPTQMTDPASLLKLVPQLFAQGDRDRAVQALRHAVDPGNPGLSPGMVLRVIDQTRELDPPTALRAARVAVANPDMHEAKRAKLEAFIEALEAEGVRDALSAADDVEVAADASGPVLAQGEAIEIDFRDEVPGDLPASRHALDVEAAPQPGDAAGPRLQDRVAAPAAMALDASGDRVSSVQEGDPTAVRAPASPPPLPESIAPLLADAAALGAGMPPPLPPATARLAAPEPPPLPPVDAHEHEHEHDDPSDLLDALIDLPRFSDLKVVEAVPLRFSDDGLYLQAPGASKAKIEFAKIEAVAVGAVSGLGAKPVLVIDLLLNWTGIGDEGPLRAVRLRSDGFDALTLMPGCAQRADALRSLVDTLLAGGDGTAVPDEDAARGRPFRSFADLAAYEREVLQIEG